MHKLLASVLLTICALGISSCAMSGRAVKPTACPVLPPIPPSLMTPPKGEQTVRDVLLQPPATTP